MTRNDETQGEGIRSFLMRTRIGSTTPLGCIVQVTITALAAALVMWLLMTLV